MRRWVSTIALALAVPALLGLQTVCGPLVACEFGRCAVTVCEFDAASAEWVCVATECEPAPPESVRTRPKTSSGCGGCGGGLKVAESSPCPPPPASGQACSSEPDKPKDCDRPCSECTSSCDACLPGRVLAVPIDNGITRKSLLPPTPAEGATIALQDAERWWTEQHSHSPPPPIIAQAGLQMCIAKCSFLL